jgi:hypothetical protein
MADGYDFEKMIEMGVGRPLWDPRSEDSERRPDSERLYWLEVQKRIDALPKDTLQLVQLHQNGCSFGQIAVLLGRPHRDRGIVCRTYQRAMKRVYGDRWRQIEAERQAEERSSKKVLSTP